MAFYRVEEYGKISVEEIERQQAEENGKQSKVSIFPDVIASGVIRVEREADRQRRGIVTEIIPQKIIGMVPLAQGVSLWVEPKVPIANIDYMAKRYGGIISRDIEELRSYAASVDSSQSMRDQLVNAFLTITREIVGRGLWHEYVRKQNNNGELIGSLDVRRTMKQYTSRNIDYKAATTFFSRTVDIAPNRILKRAILSIAKSKDEKEANRTKARNMLPRLSDVTITKTQRALFDAVTETGHLPKSRENYRKAIPLAIALVLDQGVDLSSSEGPLLMAPLFVDMSVVFENYVLCVLKQQLGNLRIETGNDQNQSQALFEDSYDTFPAALKERAINAVGTNRGHKAQPDILVYDDDGLRLVADVKYKPINKTSKEGISAKREDIEQVITYAERFGMRRVLTIHPCLCNQDAGLFYSGSVGKTAVFCYRMNLGAINLESEEVGLGLAIRALAMNNESPRQLSINDWL